MAIFDSALTRRSITIPVVVVAFVLLTMLLPALIAFALLLDLLTRRRLATVRALLMGELYLGCEVAGMLASGWVWATPGSPAEQQPRYAALQQWWGGVLFRGALRLFSLRLEMANTDAFECTRPTIFLIRHVSQIDTLLPVELLQRGHGWKLRYVLKRELAWSPSLDIVGHRLPNAFVRRDGSDTPRELQRLRNLGTGLEGGEGVVLYPEGTRFTSEKRARALTSIARNDARRAARLAERRYTLPVRRGGALALLEVAEEADVVVVAHTGLEGIAGFRDMLRSDLVGRTIRVAAWRIPRSAVPAGAEQQRQWLDDEWGRLDAWISEYREGEGR